MLETDALGKATPETEAAVQRAGKILEGAGFAVEPFRLAGLDRVIECWWFFFGPVVAHLIGRDGEGTRRDAQPHLSGIFFGGAAEEAVERRRHCSLRARIATSFARRFCGRCAMCRFCFRRCRRSRRFVTARETINWARLIVIRDTMRFSQWLNLTGFPGATVPLGMSPEGLPIGVQVIGQPYEEELVLAVAERIEAERGTWVAPPL